MSRPWSCRTFFGCVLFLVWLSGSDSCFNKPGFLALDVPDQANFEIDREIRVECRLLNNTYELESRSWHTQVDSSNLRFRKNGVVLDASSEFVEIVDNDTIAYVKKNAAINDSGTVTCYGEGPNQENSTISYSGCSSSIWVGTPPQPVLDFKCISNSFINMTCTWKNPPNKVRTKYSVEISFGVARAFGTSWQPCPKDQAHLESCSWSSTTDPSYDKMAEEFFFRITGVNALGNKSEEFSFKHGSIVKLSPVKNLVVTEISPREANLSWEAPDETDHGGWKRNLTIEYNVSIDRLNSTYNRTILTTDRSLSLRDLLPNNHYLIQVRARTKPSVRFDLDSDPVSATLNMPRAAPDGPPPFLPSAFKYKLFNNVRTVTLLFSEIPQTNWNADHFDYIVQVCPRQDEVCYNRTFENTNAELEDLSISTRYIIDVWSHNSLGPSNTSSGIVIHPQNEFLPPPTNIEVQFNSGKATLRWTTPPSLSRLESLKADVFWCKSLDQRRCLGEIFTKQVENSGSFTIELNDVRDYIYGVALSTPDGRTSGSVWSVCEINAGAHVGQVRELEALSDTDTTLRLKWKQGCGYQRKFVAGYQVEYCQMGYQEADIPSYTDKCQHELPNNASASCQQRNFTVPTEEDVYVLEGLQTGQVYRVVLRAIDNTTSKFAPDSGAVCKKVESNGLTNILLLGIAIACAFGFAVVILVIIAIAKRMGGELNSTKKAAVRLPTKTGKIDRHNPPHNRGTEMKVIESNGVHPEVDMHMTSAFDNGSHSSLDKLIHTSSLDNPLKDSEESPNLKGEPQTVVNMEVPPGAAIAAAPVSVLPGVIQQATPNGGTPYPASAMPPYTQLGLSATHFVAAPEQPRNTGYSQLSVIPIDPPAADEGGDGDDGQNDDYDNEDENDEDRAPSPEPERLPRLGPNPGYVACNVIGNNAPKANASSNGYVPAHNAMNAWSF